ncbi:MAG: CBS domain-containing protein [Candidatus Bathyarchaeota archaeon]|jgi:Zn-dependent protease/CBS domain-containing protein
MSIRIIEIADIEIRINYSWFVIFTLMTWSIAVNYLPTQYPKQSGAFYWGIGAVAAASLFLSVLVHELAHSFIAERNEIDIHSITLHFFGGVSETKEEAKTPETELKMASAGPLSSLLIGVSLLGIWLVFNPVVPLPINALLRYVSYVNIALSIFNSIPAFPMDGGRILRALIWMRSNDLLYSTKLATKASQVIGYGIMVFGLVSTIFGSPINGIWLLVISFFIQNSAKASLNETMISQALSGMKVEEIMTREVHTVEPDITLHELIENHFSQYKHRGFPVVAGDELVGIVTDQDVREVSKENRNKVRVKEVMNPANNLVTTRPDEEAADALTKMSKNDIGRMPVMQNNKLVGIVTRSDFTKTIKFKLQFKS